MGTGETMTIQLAQRAETLRVLAAKIGHEESRDAVLDWAGSYERLRSALLKWENSLAVLRENQHRLHSEAMERHLSETVQYRALVAEFQRLIRETQAWHGVFDEETEFLTRLERTTRWRFAHSRPFLVQSSHWQTS